MEFDRLLSAAADYGFPMLVSTYLLVRMEGRIEKLSARHINPRAAGKTRDANSVCTAAIVYTSKYTKELIIWHRGCRTQGTTTHLYRKAKKPRLPFLSGQAKLFLLIP